MKILTWKSNESSGLSEYIDRNLHLAVPPDASAGYKSTYEQMISLMIIIIIVMQLRLDNLYLNTRTLILIPLPFGAS